MPLANPAYWSEHLRRTLACYDEALLRRVAARLFRPRSQWPAAELVERGVATVANAAVLDRRLQELDPAGRRLLAFMAHSRQPRWRLGSLLELLAAVGCAEGPQPVFGLFEAGLLYPDLLGTSAAEPAAAERPRLRNFEQWLGQAAATGLPVFAHPDVLARALGADLGLPEWPAVSAEGGAVHEADGLEWPLRLAALWQQVAAAPLRRTQLGDFFKRDLDRLRGDPVLSAAAADNLAPLPDPGLLAVALAQAEGLVRTEEGELGAAELPPVWEEGLPATLASLWADLLSLETWDPRAGWRGASVGGNPYPAAYLLALLLLARLPGEGWARPADLEVWLLTHHPFWQGEPARPAPPSGLATFLLGLAYPLRLLQATPDSAGGWLVRLSSLGRWLLGLGERPAVAAPYPQTLLVQPNLEIVVYRQGLTPGLIGQLSRFAAWKSCGAACTMQLQADRVYRALEAGWTFEAMVQTLERHGQRPPPPAVVAALGTWAAKRERIRVYPAATLFEFASPEELNEALARGLPGVRLTDCLLAVADEQAVAFRHFRLTGTRDYQLPPEPCVAVERDGVTLAVDLTRSDLLLETELRRFAEPLDGSGVNGRRRYRLTPASLAGGRASGLGRCQLEAWFVQRAGQPLSAAARLLLDGPQLPPLQLRPRLVLHVASPEVADGLLQWPGTRPLLRERLGPTALAVAEEDAAALRQRLAALGVRVPGDGPGPAS